MSEPTKVELGESVTYRTVASKTKTVKCLAACESKTNGNWFCVTHDSGLLHGEFEKSAHLDKRGPHRMAWVCYEHGFEVP